MGSVKTLPKVRESSGGGVFGEPVRVMLMSDMVFSAGVRGLPLGLFRTVVLPYLPAGAQGPFFRAFRPDGKTGQQHCVQALIAVRLLRAQWGPGRVGGVERRRHRPLVEPRHVDRVKPRGKPSP